MSGVRAIVLRRLADAGFSLLELMAAVAILALLAAVATPLYTRYGVRAQGAAARADLMRCAQGMERHASWTFSYLGAIGADAAGSGGVDLGAVTPNLCSPTSTRYVVTLEDVGAAHFLLRTSPVGSGATDARALGLDEAGRRWRDRNGDGDFDDAGEDGWADPAE